MGRRRLFLSRRDNVVNRNKTALDFCLLRTPVIEENRVLLENAGAISGSVNQDLEGDADDEQDLEQRTHT